MGQRHEVGHAGRAGPRPAPPPRRRAAPRARAARARVRALFLACVVLATRGARASDAKADARGRALALERWARTPTRRWDAAAREEDATTAARVSESSRIVAEARGAGRGVATTRTLGAGGRLAWQCVGRWGRAARRPRAAADDADDGPAPGELEPAAAGGGWLDDGETIVVKFRRGGEPGA